jgi:hypothetical protein
MNERAVIVDSNAIVRKDSPRVSKVAGAKSNSLRGSAFSSPSSVQTNLPDLPLFCKFRKFGGPNYVRPTKSCSHT